MSLSELDKNINEYGWLLAQKKLLDKRLESLSTKIKAEMKVRVPHNTDKFAAIVWMRRGKQNIDEGALEQLIVDKNLAAECMRLKVDHDLVEQLYIEGKITDNDLRQIDAGAKLSPVLTVEKVVATDGIQRDDESPSERARDGALHDRTHSEVT